MSNECEGDFNLLWRNATIAELSYCRQSLHFIFNIQLSGMFLINLHQHNWHSLQGQLQPWLHEITKNFFWLKSFIFCSLEYDFMVTPSVSVYRDIGGGDVSGGKFKVENIWEELLVESFNIIILWLIGCC